MARIAVTSQGLPPGLVFRSRGADVCATLTKPAGASQRAGMAATR